MVASNFDSFDASELGAFIESPLGARNPGAGDRLLVWPNPPDTEPFVSLPRYIIAEIGPEWDMQDNWTGSINDYRAIIFSGLPIVDEYDWAALPPWAAAVRDGQWTGRILLDAVGDVHGAPHGAAVRATMNRIAAPYGVAASSTLVTDWTRPFNGSSPLSSHPLVEDVETIGHWSFNGSDHFGLSVITGSGTGLDAIEGVAVVQVIDKEHSSGKRTSLVMAGSGSLGTPSDPGAGGPPNWLASSYQLARNFWNVPV